MISKEQKVRLSVFLVVSVFLLLVLTAIFVLPKLKTQGDEYFIDFKNMSVNGVSMGADVKYQGVNIGQVSRMEVNPKDLSSILLYVKIKVGFNVKVNMKATLQYAGITGLRFVELSGGTTDAKNLPPGGRIPTKKGLGEKAEDIVLNVDSVVEAINDMLNVENREKISLLLKNLENSTAVVSSMLQKKEKNLEDTIENVDKITRELHETAVNLNRFTLYLNEVSEKVPVEKLEQISNHTDDLIVSINKRLSEKEMGKLLKDLDTFIETATVSIRKIENQFNDVEGELNTTLTSLRESLGNIARFTRQLSEDPTTLLRVRADKRRKK